MNFALISRCHSLKYNILGNKNSYSSINIPLFTCIDFKSCPEIHTKTGTNKGIVKEQ